MLTPESLIVLLDVDNTLLDNDRFKSDLQARLLRDFGAQGSASYWAHYDALRKELGYVDYLGALQRMREDVGTPPELLAMADWVLDYPFAERLYPDALAAIAHLGALCRTALFTDGDIVCQPRKLRAAGLWDAVDGRVLIAVHKEQAIDAMRKRFPAWRYAMVDDKPLLLAAMKRIMGDELTTVFVRQGHYAAEARNATLDPPPDRIIERIDVLRGVSREWFDLGGADAAADATGT